MFPGGQERESYGKRLPAETVWQARLFTHLVREVGARFTMVYASGAAMAQHYFWAEMEERQALNGGRGVVFDTYRALDDMLGSLRSAAGSDATVWVVSECGAGELRSGVDINRWLESAGLLEFRSRGSASWGRRLKRECLQSVRAGAQRLLPKQTFHIVNRPSVRRFVHERLAAPEVDWSRTQAYHRGKAEGAIYLNLRGREPHGIVAEHQVAEVVQRITSRLEGLRDPSTGEAVVAKVHLGEDLFEGPFASRAPDLVVEWRDHAYMPSESSSPEKAVFVPRMREFMSWPTTGWPSSRGGLLRVRPGDQARGALG